MKRDQRIGIGGHHIRAGLDEFRMHLADDVRGVDERERRPLGLLQFSAQPLQFTAHATVQNTNIAHENSLIGYRRTGTCASMKPKQRAMMAVRMR